MSAPLFLKDGDGISKCYYYITPNGQFKSIERAAIANGCSTPTAYRILFMDKKAVGWSKILIETTNCRGCGLNFPISGKTARPYCSQRCKSLRLKYNISIQEFDKMLSDQYGKCFICHIEFDKVKYKHKACVDHDHKTGKVRGLLCFSCNYAIGHIYDNLDNAQRMYSYLNKFNSHNLKIVKTRNVKTPTRATSGSSGIDFFIPNDVDWESKTIPPGDSVNIPSGIKIRIPSGFSFIAYNKSGIALKKGLIAGASVIDSDYTGEIHLHLINVSNTICTIHRGEKILQFITLFTGMFPIEECSSLDDLYDGLVTERGDGGFGSTGTR